MANALQQLHEAIADKHHLGGGAKAYLQRLKALHGGDPEKGDVVGSRPDGFGPVFDWDRERFEQVTLTAFINAGDPLGLMITGARAQDQIVVTSASGLASFTQAKGSRAVSIIGLVGGLAGGVLIFNGGDKDAAKLIVDSVNKFAEREFENKGEPKLIRDAFGIEPSSGNSAKREGGVVISLPAAGGPYYSGSDKKFNLKSNAPRLDSERPKHVKFGFFLVQGDQRHMTRRIGSDGEIYMVAWDHKFNDNAGLYRVQLTLTRDAGGIVPTPS